MRLFSEEQDSAKTRDKAAARFAMISSEPPRGEPPPADRPLGAVVDVSAADEDDDNDDDDDEERDPAVWSP